MSFCPGGFALVRLVPVGTDADLSQPEASDAALNTTARVNATDAARYRAKSDGRDCYEGAGQADREIERNTPGTRPAPLL